MSQPTITYSLVWPHNNTYQKLSTAEPYIDPITLKEVDCRSVNVTFSSTVAFKKFYATAVEEGKNYGFVDDVLVDIQGTNPTGISLDERTSGEANTNYTFTINASTLGVGSGLNKVFRIGLYAQQLDGVWNYEYFFMTTETGGEHKNFELSDGYILQTPVITN